LIEYILGFTPSSREFGLPRVELTRRQERYDSMMEEARERDDLGVGKLWVPASSNGRRPSAVLCRNAISLPTFSVECESLSSNHPTLFRSVLHFVVAVEQTEIVADEQLVQAAMFIVREVGLVEHLCVAAVHCDTPVTHAHVAVSAVNPATGKTFRMPSVRRISFYTRAAEMQFNLKAGRGQQTVVGADGRIRFATRGERAEWRREQAITRSRTRAERQADRERTCAIAAMKERATERERAPERDRSRHSERGLER
jgi:hypothetical protein